MGLFDDDPTSSDDFNGGFDRHDHTLNDGTYVGYSLRHGQQIDAMTPSEGYVGRYDANADTTYNRAGVPIGRGNWLMSFFRRG